MVEVGDALIALIALAGRDVTDTDAFDDAKEAADAPEGRATCRVLTTARGEIEVAWPTGYRRQIVPGFVA